MQGNQHFDQELLVLLLQRQRKAVDYAAQDLQQLADTVKVLGLVDIPQEDVVDLLPNERPQTEKFAVDSMQNGLQKVAFARIFAVEQL